MTIAERLQDFRQRGFNAETATVLVLIEESLHSLFTSFPNTFVLFGGATLVLFYDSQRHSGDVDLLVNCDDPPQLAEIIDAITPALNEVAETLNLAPLTIESTNPAGTFEKLSITGPQGQVLFTIDITRISALIKSELVKKPLLAGETQVQYPSKNLLLLHKAEAFLDRRNVKARDAFDVKLLLDTGAELDVNLKLHLQDGTVSERLEDPDFIHKRIDAINPRLCEAELRGYLPDEVFQELARQEFEPLRQALRDLFSEWL
jgi:hypothetical protein